MADDFGRLAMRVEGDWWVAYFAKPGTMNGALELGRLKATIAHLPGVKDATLQFYRLVVSAMVKEATGAGLTWPEGPKGAPEHERSGRA